MAEWKIDGKVHDRKKRVVKVRIDGILYNTSEVWDWITHRGDRVFAVFGDKRAAVQPRTSPNGLKYLVSDPDSSGRNNLDELPYCPMQMLVFGDSVQWGQGLLKTEKMYYLAREHLSLLNGSVAVSSVNLAHSGAEIGDGTEGTSQRAPLDIDGENINGESPSWKPTVRDQVRLWEGDGATVDYIVLDGGINDVELLNILDTSDRRDGITALAHEMCHDRMAALLADVMAKFPNARIIVTGYYPVISERTNPANPAQLTAAIAVLTHGFFTDHVFPFAERRNLVANSRTFAAESTAALQAAVAEANAQSSGNPRVFLAAPRFEEGESLFAPRSLLFGVRGDYTAEDGRVHERNVQCATETRDFPSMTACKLASIGHPNPAGAVRYFEAMKQFL
jgi:hypothetical protein